MVTLHSNKHILEIKGKLYSGNVTEIQQQIEYALKRLRSLIINIQNISEMDISGVFMLYLVKRLAAEKRWEINFIGTDNEVFKNALSISGVGHVFISAAA